MIHEKAKWIWKSGGSTKNEFVYFENGFEFISGTAVLSVAAETDYIAYINGREVAFGQYAGYPDLKFCDEIDVTDYCAKGSNTLALTVRYEGVNSATHIDDGAGVIYSLECSGELLAYSSEGTLSALDGRYVSGEMRTITVQLGLAADMKVGEHSKLSPSAAVEKTRNIKKCPVKKTELMQPVSGRETVEKKRLFDLGRETVGYLYLKCRADGAAAVRVAYGEHIADGGVRYLIEERNFSLVFHTEAGEHVFCQKFVRIAARYLEIFAPECVAIEDVGIIPALYPLTEKEHGLSGLDKDIYEVSVRTLRLCMNRHYEDCPWREQGLYVLDSRNQMLSGYYAFKETEFQRGSLALISHGGRDDGFLELTFPAVGTPAIPFFSIMYPVAVWEYIEHTGDRSILDVTFERMMKIMAGARERIGSDGLIHEFEKPYWNFYEWSDGSSGSVTPGHHLILNCALIYSYERFSELCKMRGSDLALDTARMKEAIKRSFYHADTGLFHLSSTDTDKYSELGQAFALLIGLGDERTVEAIKSGELIPATLSMLGFVYDALLAFSHENKEYVLADIRKKYGYMLSQGATSFWETIEGESAFKRAGSLCHGWSAMPVCYLKSLVCAEETRDDV